MDMTQQLNVFKKELSVPCRTSATRRITIVQLYRTFKSSRKNAGNAVTGLVQVERARTSSPA
jgi:hypothetical protein